MTSLLRSPLFALLLLFAAPVLAQPDAGDVSTGVILGTVLDGKTKKPVFEVVITATSPSLRFERVAVSDGQGNFRIEALPAGVYALRAEREVYKPSARTGLHLQEQRTVRVDMELEPDPSFSTSAAPLVDMNSANSNAVVDAEFIKRIAMARPVGKGGARSFESLAEVAPGSASDSYGVSLHDSAMSGVPEGGYVIDGLSTNDYVSESSRNDRQRAPAWALPYMHIVVPDGTPQTVYRAPEVPRGPLNDTHDIVIVAPPERTVAPPGKRFFDMYFKGHGVNPTVDTEEERFSTFSVDTDTASYTLTRAYLQRGSLPDEQAVRVEEFVNSFDYGYPAAPDAPFSVNVEGFPSPARKGYHVVRIGVKAREVSHAQRKPSHLVFVIDVSGSMNMDNRLGLVKRALNLLVNALDERDRVSIVVYGSEARLVLGPTNARQKSLLRAAIDGLTTEGSTNAQAGLELGYALAANHLQEGGINRIILCSDGVANSGITDADGLWARVKERAAAGITLSAVGFGMGNYNDALMERMAQVGEGNYAYVDALDEARRIFVQNLSGTLQVVAKDVKLQVEFDRKTVSRYRLIGYENRLLTRQQFSDDSVDAGEVGAGHAVTALYEVKLREASRPTFGTLRIRYKQPEGGDSRLIEKDMTSSLMRPAFEQAASPTRLSYVAAAFAEKLRGSYWARPLTYDALVSLWEELGTPLKDQEDVAELGTLIREARKLDRRKDRFESFAPVRTMDADRVPTFK
ncbi:DUF3520 domain-containing protein [Corallococcus praedator]|uniref:DUF3520 domain-containing protein n=1 Tax=Corallococcus praedator TaxID=2316724 RepID=A0ABX9QRP3_9BACT|nr:MULTISPECIES: von Willebrand factor type A domain-containing protein [Corallococcus]RKH21177.1 DUF3520 domain-containing protein [Corallococcus sp. CA047B]RKH35915.1 DUF3520 domain-containing protein [Corallococcus sp. CA031C]RKI17621.1 DUF3520 domain-containing protein [Corallococcus praedator]